MNYLEICKQTTPQKLYHDEGFGSLEGAVKNLGIERSDCISGYIDGRRLKSYDKLYSIWKSYFDKVLPNHINESSYMNAEQVQSYLKRNAPKQMRILEIKNNILNNYGGVEEFVKNYGGDYFYEEYVNWFMNVTDYSDKNLDKFVDKWDICFPE